MVQILAWAKRRARSQPEEYIQVPISVPGLHGVLQIGCPYPRHFEQLCYPVSRATPFASPDEMPVLLGPPGSGLIALCAHCRRQR